MSNRPVGVVFRAGDLVVLAEGTYQGTPGVFLRLRKDVNWADITESDGSIRSHPLEWLDHSTGAADATGTRWNRFAAPTLIEVTAGATGPGLGCPSNGNLPAE